MGQWSQWCQSTVKLLTLIVTTHFYYAPEFPDLGCRRVRSYDIYYVYVHHLPPMWTTKTSVTKVNEKERLHQNRGSLQVIGKKKIKYFLLSNFLPKAHMTSYEMAPKLISRSFLGVKLKYSKKRIFILFFVSKTCMRSTASLERCVLYWHVLAVAFLKRMIGCPM